MTQGRSRMYWRSRTGTAPALVVALVALITALLIPATQASAAPGDGPWGEAGHGYRVPVTVTPATSTSVLYATTTIDFSAAFAEAGATSLAFDPQSIKVHETDVNGAPISATTNAQFDPGTGYDPTTNALGELVLEVTGPVVAGQDRHYLVYFDATGSGAVGATATDQVVLTQGQFDEGLPAISVATSTATWWYQPEAGGFSSLTDPVGNDWIGWSTAPKTAGEYRGIPNLVHPADYFHPGATGHVTQVLTDGPLRAQLTTVSPDGQWEMQWDFYADHATGTVLVADAPYWFQYEGVPGGLLERATDFWATSNGTKKTLEKKFITDLDAPEWVQLGDPIVDRSIFVINHTDDAAVDTYKTAATEMTVMAFGREDLNKGLTGTDRSFSVGLLDTADQTTAATAINGLVTAPTVTVGAGQSRVIDTTDPQIVSGPTATAASTSIAIAIETDELTTAQVAYGLTAGLELGTVDGPSSTTNHTVTLTGLDCETEYHFVVTVADGSGNSATSAASTATTTTCTTTYPLDIVLVGDGAGAVTMSPDLAEYEAGQVVTLTAAPNAGSTFVRWTGDVTSTSPTVDLVMPGTAATVMARFNTVAPPTGTQPLVRYNFEEGSGTAIGDSGTGAPLDLTLDDPASATWVTGGLEMSGATLASSGPATKIYDAVQTTGEMTIEAWVTPANVTQGGPARIVSSASDPRTRNFMLGQGAWGSKADDVFSARFRRSTNTAGNPTMFTPTGSASTTLTHVVYTRTASGVQTLYVDGVDAGSVTKSGDLSNWDTSFPLTVGNISTGNRRWFGVLCEVAIYDVALSSTDVSANHSAGCNAPTGGGNNAPVLASMANRTSTEGATVSVQASATDSDGDTLTYSATGLPNDTTINAATGLISGDIAVGAAAGSPYAVSVTVDDGNGATDTESFSWTINEPSAGGGRVTDGLVVFYDVEEGSGPTLIDTAGNGPALDLTIADPGNTTRVPGAIRIDAETIIESSGPATKITSALTASGQVTLEAWIEPANLSQNGPARIVTLSEGSGDRNMTLGQGVFNNGSDRVDVRLRTSATSDNGVPSLSTDEGTLSTDLTHVVYTRAANGIARIYLNGVLVETDTVAGNLSNWDSTYSFAIGNEVDASRDWLGTVHLVAVYDQGLTVAEVAQNYNAGPNGDGTIPNQAPTAAFTATPTSGVAPVLVSFDASASSDDGTIVSYSWDLGDGTSGNGATLGHTYTAPGVYNVTLTVTDDQGATDQRTTAISATTTGGGGPSGVVDWTHLSSDNGDLVPPGTQPQQTVALVGDIDLDGTNDFVIGTRKGTAGPSVVWYERRANDWLQHIVEPDLLELEAGGAMYDIDSDGDLDIVIGGHISDQEIWWWENPAPNFANRWDRHLIKDSGGKQHHDQAFGDVDGDGQVEFIYWVNREDKLYVADIPTDPTSGPWPATAIYNAPTVSEGLAIIDIDGNGVDDIVGAGFWFEFSAGSYIPHEIDLAMAFTRVEAAQLVDGGRPEVVFDSGDAIGQVRMYEWIGGSWVGRDILGVLSEYGHSLSIGDVNDDGDLDVVSGEMFIGTNRDPVLRVLYGDGNGGFTVDEIATGFDNHESKLADLDGDGDLDILGKPFREDVPGLNIWINNGAPPSLDQWERTVADSSVPWRTIFIEHGDIDGDGDEDLISGGWWWRNPGSVDGSWVRNTIGAPLNQMAAVYDFDGDGDLDILGTQAQGSSSNDSFAWARNNGSGSFTVFTNIDVADGTFLQGVTVAEFQPGTIEVALSWQNGRGGLQMLTVPSNPATGTWTWRSASSNVSGEGLDNGDIDDDGDLDILDGGSWFRNDGGGSFTRFTLHNPATGEPDRNLLRDMDGDGDLDAVIGYGHDETEGKVAWYEQGANPQALWTEHLVANVAPGMAQSLDVADVDGDGDLDLMIGEHTNPATGGLSALLFENTGNDTWTTHEIHVGDEHHDGTQFVDLDGDGDLDVVSIGWLHRDLLIYENKN